MSSAIARKLDRILRRVEKPARYVGAETNQTVKAAESVRASIALAFPDVYDIGMSYHGYKVLYELVNGREGFAAERTFAPWPDMEDLMRAEGLPLYALESKRPVAEFDLVGFTLQHEVNYTNILNMIDLAGLPVESRARPDLFPLIVGGGEGAMAPEPLAPFFDLFVIGDGEGSLLALMQLVEDAKAEGLSDKREFLVRASRLDGLYVPSFYEMKYGDDGTVAAFERIEPEAPETIGKALFDLRGDLGPVKPVVPNLRVVHDRLAIEIKRGCTRGCRFCSAGMITRPVRERTPDQIVEIAESGLRNTGFDEIALLSLSSADYTCILPSVRMLREAFKTQRIAISLPSLRINDFDVALADEIAQVRKSGFTFAPEAGTDRLRRVINKVVDRESFLRIIESVCAKGWKTLKFYFMIGLPTETDEDLDGIVDLVREAERIGRKRWGRGLKINVGLSPYVPKPHTPFQWYPQTPTDEMKRRYVYVLKQLRNKSVAIKTHDRETSFVEAVLARGDRRVGMAMKRAWELGAKFDGWKEHFRYDAWTQAFEELGVDPDFYATRERGKEEILPWDHIDPGLGKDFLWKEWRLALREAPVPDCSVKACVGCDVCGDEVDHQMADEVWPFDTAPSNEDDKGKMRRSKNGTLHARLAPPPFEPIAVEPREGTGPKKGRPAPPSTGRAPVQRIEARFSRMGYQKTLSHLDVVKIVHMACARGRLPLAYTEGFNPRPKTRFLPPMPVGFESLDEVADISLSERQDLKDLLKSLNASLPDGMDARSAVEIPLRSEAPEARLIQSNWRVEIPADVVKEKGLEADRLAESFGSFRDALSFPFEKHSHKKNKSRTIDLRKCATDLSDPEIDGDGGISISISTAHTLDYASPLETISAISGVALSYADGVSVRRESAELKPCLPLDRAE